MKNAKIIISYVTGFSFSLLCTIGAYSLVLIHLTSHHRLISHSILIPAVLFIAFLQLFVQLIFFLHIGKKQGPRWNALTFFITFAGILLVIIGSMWIMYHLNYNMTPAQMNQYIQDQSGF